MSAAADTCPLCKGARLYPDSYRAGAKKRRSTTGPMCNGHGRVFISNGRPAPANVRP